MPGTETQVILRVVIEVATESTSVAFVRARHADLQVGPAIPEHLGVRQRNGGWLPKQPPPTAKPGSAPVHLPAGSLTGPESQNQNQNSLGHLEELVPGFEGSWGKAPACLRVAQQALLMTLH